MILFWVLTLSSVCTADVLYLTVTSPFNATIVEQYSSLLIQWNPNPDNPRDPHDPTVGISWLDPSGYDSGLIVDSTANTGSFCWMVDQGPTEGNSIQSYTIAVFGASGMGLSDPFAIKACINNCAPGKKADCSLTSSLTTQGVIVGVLVGILVALFVIYRGMGYYARKFQERYLTSRQTQQLELDRERDKHLSTVLGTRASCEWNWSRVALVIAFVRANADNPIRYSILDLSKEVMLMIGAPLSAQQRRRRLTSGWTVGGRLSIDIPTGSTNPSAIGTADCPPKSGSTKKLENEFDNALCPSPLTPISSPGSLLSFGSQTKLVDKPASQTSPVAPIGTSTRHLDSKMMEYNTANSFRARSSSAVLAMVEKYEEEDLRQTAYIADWEDLEDE